jgi:hypothetical protein
MLSMRISGGRAGSKTIGAAFGAATALGRGSYASMRKPRLRHSEEQGIGETTETCPPSVATKDGELQRIAAEARYKDLELVQEARADARGLNVVPIQDRSEIRFGRRRQGNAHQR